MTFASVIGVGAFVWVIGLIPRIDLRAIAYSFPIPMTIILIANNSVITASQIFGVMLLNIFFFVIALSSKYTGFMSWIRVAIAVASYIIVSVAVSTLPQMNFWVVVVIYLSGWIALVSILFRRRKISQQIDHDCSHAAFGAREQAKRILLICVVCFCVFAAASLMGGLVVTFPFAGVLVAFGLNRDAACPFARQFAVTSIALIAFFAAIYYAQSFGFSLKYATACGWVAFGLALTTVASAQRVLRR